MAAQVRIFSANLWALEEHDKHMSVPLLPTKRSVGGGPSVNGGEIYRELLGKHEGSLLGPESVSNMQNCW